MQSDLIEKSPVATGYSEPIQQELMVNKTIAHGANVFIGYILANEIFLSENINPSLSQSK